MKRKIRFLLLILVFMVLLSGCRESEVLVQKVYNQQANDVVDDDQIIHNDPENETEDESLFAVAKNDDSDNKEDPEESLARKDEDTAQSNQDSVKVKQDDNASSDLKSNQSDKNKKTDSKKKSKAPGDGDRGGNDGNKDKESQEESKAEESSGEESKEKETESEDNGSGGNGNQGDNDEESSDATEGDNEESTEESTEAETKNPVNSTEESTENQTDPAEDGDTTKYKEVVDARGKTVKVPEDVSSVSAVGEAAVMVQMLGGEGLLSITSKDFKNNAMLQTVFADEGAASVKTLWADNGSSKLDSSDFKTLLDSGVEVCFEISGQATFSDAQVSELEDNKIAYVVLPSLETVTGIASASSIIAQVLGDHSGTGGENAILNASDYTTWVTKIVDKVSKKTGTQRYTLMISDWDASAQYSITKDSGYKFTQKGLAVAETGDTTSFLRSCMDVANITSYAFSGSYGSSVKKYYVNPICSVYHQFSIVGGDGIKYDKDINATRLTGGVPNGSTGTANNSETKAGLGTANYPAVITSTNNVKEKLENSIANSEYYRGHSKASGTQYGWLDDEGVVVISSIVDDYDIYVNPYGISDWSSGSAESPLEIAWMSYCIQGVYNLSDFKNTYLKDFYKTFYRYDLSSSEINTILQGK